MRLQIKHCFLYCSSILLLLSSCKKTFDLKPINELDATQAYLTVSDADAAVIGLYGKFQGLADRYIILNELRGDLMQYTNNADENLRQISNHSVSPDNPYASPRPFYELIINCNDVLKNFNIMRQTNRLKVAEYDQRYSDVACLRSFLYLQLGIHYGEVPYVTDALESVDAIKNTALFPKLPFNTLLDSLINFTERIPYTELYPAGSLNTPVDGYPSAKFFIPKKMILGDLNLWKGNYVQAATWYRQIMETVTTQASGTEAYYGKYRIGTVTPAANDHYIVYSRANDATSLVVNGAQWRYMFERPYDNGFDFEWIWAIPFDNRFAPNSPLINLFSPIGGSYLVKPSQQVFDLWNSQQQRGTTNQGVGLPYDARGQLSWKNIGVQPTIMKFLYNYIQNTTNLPVNPLLRNGKWFLWRQTNLHLRFSEAANRAGRNRLAYALLNSGIRAAYARPSTQPDATLYENTLFDSYPFNFDARNGETPSYRGDWHRNSGIRARANLLNMSLPATTPADSTLRIEDALIQEAALENAFEGTRWPDLLRIALRRNDPAFLAKKIGDKLRKDGVANAAAIEANLMNKANWYLPFKL